MAFAVKMIVAAVAALAFVSQVSCKPLAPIYSAPVISAAPALTTYHAPLPLASVAHVPAVTHVATSYPAYGYYGAKYAAALPAVPAYHYPTFPAASALSYPSSFGYGYPSGFSSTTYHHPLGSTTYLHK